MCPIASLTKRMTLLTDKKEIDCLLQLHLIVNRVCIVAGFTVVIVRLRLLFLHFINNNSIKVQLFDTYQSQQYSYQNTKNITILLLPSFFQQFKSDQLLMNRFAFDSQKEVIQEWQQVYFGEDIIDSFQTMIDKTHMFLQIINNHKQRQTKQKRLKSKKSLCSDMQQGDEDGIGSQIKYFYNLDSSIRRIDEWIDSINDLKKEVEIQRGSGGSDMNQDKTKVDLCSKHLSMITVQSFKFYNAVLHQDFTIIKEFMTIKFAQLRTKYQKLQRYFEHIAPENESYKIVRIIFENLFIQTEYLKKLVRKNKNIFEKHSHEKEFSSGYQQINEIRQKFILQLQNQGQQIEQMKEKLRVYYNTYIKRSKKQIRNHQKLQKKICHQIAVNSEQYVRDSSSISFMNGFTFAFLTCALVAIIIFRQVNLSQLQNDNNYLRGFKVWRGASYLIYFNWIIGFVFWLFKKFRINYRLILIEEDTFLPNHQTFFLSASILSAIYLTLFLIYLLYKLKIIVGHSAIEHMGFFMWGINLIFLLNPFKFLNYEGRRYFLSLFYKFIMSLFRPMNMNIFFVAIIIGSFVQPFSDFAFMACQISHLQQIECVNETNVATFVFTMTFLFYRFVQSIRSHQQFGDRCYSRPLIGITAVISSMNTVISSYLYNIYLTDQLLNYWIVSAILSTIAGIQADLRADWGLISFDKQDKILRKYKYFPRATYFIVSVIDIVLNIGWVLTISNNTASNIGINPVYFLMILSYVELARKGMWIFFRIQEDHSQNIANFKALLDDTGLYKCLDQSLSLRGPFSFQLILNKQNDIEVTLEEIAAGDKQGFSTFQQNVVQNTSSENNGKKYQMIDKRSSKLQNQQSAQKKPKTLSEIQRMIINKKLIRNSLTKLIGVLEGYLKIIHQIYKNLDWDGEE